MIVGIGINLTACSEYTINNKNDQDSEKNNTEMSKNKKDSLPISNPNDWRITLVNRNHILLKELSIPLTNVTENAHPNMKIDKRISSDYQDMVAAAKADGINLYLRSSHRTIELQRTYYESTFKSYKSQGLSDEDAKAKTLEYIQYPGASEHHTGLALDIISVEWQNTAKHLTEHFDNTDSFKWLDEYAAEYGFIIRYPKGKENITGVNYEPWHYRYVGKDVAIYLKEQGLTLEEYCQKIKF
ncbi:M15 family metallopeptidase [Bacillus thuringiensis]|uniref:M15 family metallopeptidase n=1 Tax=Bacillus thuringiensis TaxID=1428 RepID=UPI0026E48A33|nr:M15 family metallopeptidase [Bacillus thuringiensis]MED1305512.1 M15 family metallopeptidase [Bacillus pacificus]